MSPTANSVKPKNPWPPIARRVLRRVLPHRIYRRHIGRHEDCSLAIWRGLARVVPPETAILDIGAFHGEFSLAARAENSALKIFAFEPNHANRETLCPSCAANDIDVVAAAVADRDGVVRFVYSAATSHIADTSAMLSSGSTSEGEDVPALALDTWLAGRGVTVSLVKVDVEGAEAMVLRGARTMLRSSEPIILCEVLSDAAGDAVMRELPPSYRYWHIDENRGVAPRQRITRKKWRNKNWLLVPESKAAWCASVERWPSSPQS